MCSGKVAGPLLAGGEKNTAGVAAAMVAGGVCRRRSATRERERCREARETKGAAGWVLAMNFREEDDEHKHIYT